MKILSVFFAVSLVIVGAILGSFFGWVLTFFLKVLCLGMCDFGFVTIGMLIGGLLGLIAGLIPIYLAFKIGNFSNQIRILRSNSCRQCGSKLLTPGSLNCDECGVSP